MKKVLFKEEQRFRQWWLWLITVFVIVFAIIPLVKIIVEDKARISSSNAHLILYAVGAVLFLATAIVIMLFIQLKTKITSEGIYVAYLPFFRKWKKIAKDEIVGYKLRRYQAVWEYGGYGMKSRRKAGKAYTISGNTGLQLYFKNGEKLLIGTQKKQALEYAMFKFAGDKLKLLTNESVNKERAKQLLGRKTRKILIILAIELVVIILIFAITQVFK